MDLRAVTLSVEDDVVVRAELAGPIPQADTAMVGVNVSSTDGNTFRQLAVKWVDGTAPGPFVFDMGSAKQENLPASALEVDGRTVTLTFPTSAVDDIGDGWKWGAFTTAAGADVDACPGPVGGMKMQPF